MITGYTGQFVSRQRYLTISSILDNIRRQPLDTTTNLTAEEFADRPGRMSISMHAGYRYFAQVFYKEGYSPTWGEEDMFDILSITDAITGEELVHLTKEKYLSHPWSTSSRSKKPYPRMLISMGRSVTLIEDLTDTTYWLIRETQRMPKRLYIDPKVSKATVGDIINMDLLKTWLPDGTVFDLDRMPANDKIIPHRFEDDILIPGIPRWECFEDGSTSKWMQVLRHMKPRYRWIRYSDFKAGCDYDRRTRSIPLNAIPEDRSVLMIPMKNKSDTRIRDCRDDFEMAVEILHYDSNVSKADRAIIDIMQHVENL